MRAIADVGRARQLRWALALAAFTVAWNVLEGLVAIGAAVTSGSRALIGFGVDSFVESISAAVLIWRLRTEQRDPHRAEEAERRALRYIGFAFFGLAALVGVESVRSLLTGERPESSSVGIVLTVVSLLVMPILATTKRNIGRQMGARSVEADASQTWACVYLSAIVLAGLVLNAWIGWWWADPAAALVVVALLVHEGRETLQADHVDDCC